MPTSKGDITKTLFLKSESHKLGQEFTVATGQSVKKGDLARIEADGKISAVRPGSAALLSKYHCVGVILHDGEAGELVTVSCKGFMIVFGQAAANSTPAGPVKMSAPVGASPDRLVNYATCDVATEPELMLGWALDAGDQNDEIRVLISA